MKQKILCIVIIILSICVIVLSLLSVFDVLFVPGLLPCLVAITMGGLYLINRTNYKKGYIKKAFWITLVTALVAGAIANIVLAIVQLIQYFA